MESLCRACGSELEIVELCEDAANLYAGDAIIV